MEEGESQGLRYPGMREARLMSLISNNEEVYHSEVADAVYSSLKFIGKLPLFSGAVCATVDPEIFFPEQGGTPRHAKKLCEGCPVRIPCRDFAFEHNIKYGIWGGLTYKDRTRLLKLVEVEDAS
jgi:WhiB family redox-sensing transcriptional regulator